MITGPLVLAYLAGVATVPLAVLIVLAVISYAAAVGEDEAETWRLQ
jgi:hypothetical protein